MFSRTWKTSERKYGIIAERHVKIKVDDSVEIDADIFRPDAKLQKFPAILGMHPYDNAWQSDPLMPGGVAAPRGHAEAGDPEFFARRGYAQIIANVRGTGDSGGKFSVLGAREAQDTVEVIDWIARQRWSDGNVGMFGSSYFTWAQYHAAALNPGNLKCIFATFGATDIYRHVYYHGGILSHLFLTEWSNGFSNPRIESVMKSELGEPDFRRAVENAARQKDISAVPSLAAALMHPETGTNPLKVDVILNEFYGPYYEERTAKLDQIRIPAYLGADWGMYGLHTPGAFSSWEQIKGPKKMVMGPSIYYDRPQYQPMYEALRWFDRWLKGMKNGIQEEPDTRLFIPGTDDWKTAQEWPLPETKWTPFYLHSGNLLSEHEYWKNEGYSTYEDSIFNRGEITFLSPPLVENTEVIGPVLLELYGSSTDEEVLWFVSLLEVDLEGNVRILTRGWLRGTHMRIDETKSKSYEVFHPHTEAQSLLPDHIYVFKINLIPTANLFRRRYRIGLRIKSADNEKPVSYLERVATGHLWRQKASRVTVYHNSDYPSCLYIPITKGNVQGTYLSGGDVPEGLVPVYRYAQP